MGLSATVAALASAGGWAIGGSTGGSVGRDVMPPVPLLVAA
jgi:hypothetical protein